MNLIHSVWFSSQNERYVSVFPGERGGEIYEVLVLISLFHAYEITLSFQTDLGNCISFPTLIFGGGFKFTL